MIFAALLLSLIVGSFAGYKIARWAKALPKVEAERYYAPSVEEQMYLNHIGKF